MNQTRRQAKGHTASKERERERIAERAQKNREGEGQAAQQPRRLYDEIKPSPPIQAHILMTRK
jgi:hypothetical protein